jgi:hypothetical protein
VGQEVGVDPDLARPEQPQHGREPLEVLTLRVRDDVNGLRRPDGAVDADGEPADEDEAHAAG